MSKKYNAKIEKIRKLRSEFWPDVTEDMIWNEKLEKQEAPGGWTIVPRILPYLLKIMDELSLEVTEEKGKPVSNTYLALWFRNDTPGVIKIDDEEMLAFESKFYKKGNKSAWRARIRILEELGFIKTKKTVSGKYSYILILDPYLVINELRKNPEKSKKYPIDKHSWEALLERAINIGAGAAEALETEESE
jgi:hypothetical protein